MRLMVLHQGAYPGRSGAEAMAAATAAQALRRGHSVAFATDPRSLARDGGAPAGMEVLDVHGPWAEAARRWRPDVIHLVDLVSARLSAAALAVSEACAAPLVVTPASASGTWEDAALGGSVLAAARAVLVLTAAEARHLATVAPDLGNLGRTVAIGQGADLPALAGSVHEFRAAHGIGGPTILFLARRLRSKGLWRLVEAMPRLRSRLGDAVLVVAGPAGDDHCLDGTGSGREPRPVPRPGAGAGIVDLGLVSDAGKRLALAACDVLCLPTEQDVFPVSFVEAWRCGKAVATTAFDGAEEVVRHGVDGVILDAEPAALADGLAALLADAPRLAGLGEAGRQRAARELTWEAVGERIEAAYASVRDRGGAARRPYAGCGRAIVLAGGLGRRLRTDGVGEIKPLASIGGVPLLEILLRQLAAQGFERATLCITPATEAIRERIGDGALLGLAVDYSRSETLLGTAGPLRLVADWTETALVVNGDLLTAFDYAALRRWHLDRGCAATVALVRPPIPVPFGVVETDAAGRVRSLEEKPVLRPLCASGVYVLEPEVLGVLGDGRLDMPEALLRLLGAGRPVGGRELAERWHDVGTAEALRLAEADFLAHTRDFLPAALPAGRA
jgi:glycosyltransferase involved in cell wall biosynthesis/dTDP-glucose pyrophosphorylase